MTSMTALKIARDQLRAHPSHRAVFCERPRGERFHVYVGRLTRSRRYVPRTGRPVCGSRTGRLRVCWGPIAVGTRAGRTLCHRCAAAAARIAPPTSPFDKATPLALLDLEAAALAVACHAEVHHVQGAAIRHGALTAGPVVAQHIDAGLRRYPDPDCCALPAKHADLSLEYTRGITAREVARANLRRLGAGALRPRPPR